MILNIDNQNYKFDTFEEMDHFLKTKNLERTVGHCKEYCVRILKTAGALSSSYICGTITDDSGHPIKATEEDVLKTYGQTW